MSLLVEGCMEKGKDVAAGGAMVNHGPGLIFSGLATYVEDDPLQRATQIARTIAAERQAAGAEALAC